MSEPPNHFEVEAQVVGLDRPALPLSPCEARGHVQLTERPADSHAGLAHTLKGQIALVERQKRGEPGDEETWEGRPGRIPARGEGRASPLGDREVGKGLLSAEAHHEVERSSPDQDLAEIPRGERKPCPPPGPVFRAPYRPERLPVPPQREPDRIRTPLFH